MNESLKCFHKNTNCPSSKNCEDSIIECSEASGAHCYSIAEKVLDSNGTSRTEIVYAGCLPSTEDCKTPVELAAKFNATLHSTHQHSKFSDKFIEFLRTYKIPSSLLEPSIQDKCIAYAKEPHDHNWYTQNNRTFCCCSKNMCNVDIYHTEERSPHEIYAINLNPSDKRPLNDSENAPFFTFDTTTLSQQTSTNHFFLNQRDITIICLTSLVAILIFTVFLLLFFLARKKLFKNEKNNHYPSVMYTKAAGSNPDVANLSNTQKVKVFRF